MSSIYFIDSFETLQQKFSFLDDEHARHTWKVITDVVHYPDSEDDETGSPASSICSSENDREDSDSNTGSDSDDSDIVRYRLHGVQLESSSEGEHTGIDELYS